jgi:2-phospho-L-lactate/phosphoenolpyruvate guanylyltransferase
MRNRNLSEVPILDSSFFRGTATVARVGFGHRKVAVLVPMKPFGLAKTRLAPAFSDSERENLARSMLQQVVSAAQGLRVAIVAPETAVDVRRFALINGARFLAEPSPGGLDVAVHSGKNQLAARGYDRIIVVHSDLPLVKDITWLADTDDVIIVPDRSGKGTNAISIPSDCDFRFSFGPGSFERHEAEARRLGFDPKTVVDVEGVSADVDEPEDAKRCGVLLPG